MSRHLFQALSHHTELCYKRDPFCITVQKNCQDNRVHNMTLQKYPEEQALTQARCCQYILSSAGRQVCLIFFCCNGLCSNGFMDLDPHTLREDLNVFPAVSAYIMQKGNSWGHTFLIELNLPNHNPSMFFRIPADESSCRAQSGQSTFLLLLIVSVPKKLSHPLVMFGFLLCFVYFGYPQKRRPA